MLQRSLGADERGRQGINGGLGVVLVCGLCAEFGGELGDVVKRCGLTKGDGDLLGADSAHEVTLLLKGCLDACGVDVGDSDGVEELVSDQGLACALYSSGEEAASP